jgi:hypothetical protein
MPGAIVPAVAAVVLPVNAIARVVARDVVTARARPVVRLSHIVVVDDVTVVIERRVDDAAPAVEPVAPVAVPPTVVAAMDPVVSPQRVILGVVLRDVVDNAVDVVERHPGVIVEDGIVEVVLRRVVVGVDLHLHLGADGARPRQHGQAHGPEEERLDTLHRLFLPVMDSTYCSTTGIDEV